MRLKIYHFIPLLLLGSCNHYFYAPNTQNVPMMREKNEARVSIGALSGDQTSGVESQLAYSPVNHLGLTFNFANANGGDGFDKGYGNQLEGGIGFYQPIDDHFNFEVYAGFGGGKIYNQYDSLESYKLNFTKLYIQPAIGYTSDYFDAIFSFRIAYLGIQSSDIDNAVATSHSEVLQVAKTPKSFLIEPAITLRGGWKYIVSTPPTTSCLVP